MVKPARGMSSDTVKALVLQYWRYDRQSPLVALEWGGRDVANVQRSYLIETEVKVSMADLRREISKPIHCYIRRLLGAPLEIGVNWGFAMKRGLRDRDHDFLLNIVRMRQYYIAVPEDIEEKALPVIEELFPYAGVIVVYLYKNVRDSMTRYGDARKVKDAQILPVRRLTTREMADMAKAQSATFDPVSVKDRPIGQGGVCMPVENTYKYARASGGTYYHMLPTNDGVAMYSAICGYRPRGKRGGWRVIYDLPAHKPLCPHCRRKAEEAAHG